MPTTLLETTHRPASDLATFDVNLNAPLLQTEPVAPDDDGQSHPANDDPDL